MTPTGPVAAIAAAAVAGFAMLAWLPPPARRRLKRLRGASKSHIRPELRRTVALVAIPSLGALVLLGPVPAALVAVGLTASAGRVISWWQRRQELRKRAEAYRDLPAALSLLTAALDAGRAPEPALQTVLEALSAPSSTLQGSQLCAELAEVAIRLRANADHVAVWSQLGDSPLAGVGRAIARAETSGTAVARAVADAASEARREQQKRRHDAAARLGVSTTVPMGLCFLPGFMLVTVTPLLVGILSDNLL